MIDAVQVTHVLDNRKSESEANMWIDSSIGTERQHKISEVKEEGSEHGGEVGLTAKGEVSWKAGVPGWASGGSKAGLEASGKYVGKKVEKKIVGEENTSIIKVSCCIRGVIGFDANTANRRLSAFVSTIWFLEEAWSDA